MQRTIVIIIILAIIIIGGAYWFTQTGENQVPAPISTGTSTATSTQTYTLAQIAPHNNQNDCLMAIEGRVYDVTSFIPNHPGGEAILLGCGRDATTLFNNRPGEGTPHPDEVRQFLPNYYIGDLAQI